MVNVSLLTLVEIPVPPEMVIVSSLVPATAVPLSDATFLKIFCELPLSVFANVIVSFVDWSVVNAPPVPKPSPASIVIVASLAALGIVGVPVSDE